MIPPDPPAPPPDEPARRRLVLPPGSVQGERVTVAGAHYHYLFRVLRLAVGDPVDLVEPPDRLHHGRVDAVDRQQGVVRILRSETTPRRAGPGLELLHGLARVGRSELVLQKATELGVDALWPVLCRRSVRRIEDFSRRARRWQQIVGEAARQSGRTDLPRLEPALPLGEALDRLPPGGARLVAAPEAPPLSRLADALDAEGERVILLVGPEGGLDPEELERATADGFVPVSLGPLVQRTETAALALLSAVAYLTGRWG